MHEKPKHSDRGRKAQVERIDYRRDKGGDKYNKNIKYRYISNIRITILLVKKIGHRNINFNSILISL